MLANDLPPDKLEQLLAEGYSVSPKSGRLRKKHRNKKSPLTKKRIQKKAQTLIWIIIIAAFLASLVIVLPELGIVSDNKPAIKQNLQRTR